MGKRRRATAQRSEVKGCWNLGIASCRPRQLSAPASGNRASSDGGTVRGDWDVVLWRCQAGGAPGWFSFHYITRELLWKFPSIFLGNTVVALSHRLSRQSANDFTNRLSPSYHRQHDHSPLWSIKGSISLGLACLTSGYKEASGWTDGNILTPICGNVGWPN